MVVKAARTIKLSPELERRIEALIGTYYGDSRNEVITFILKAWLHTNHDQLTELITEADTVESPQ